MYIYIREPGHLHMKPRLAEIFSMSNSCPSITGEFWEGVCGEPRSISPRGNPASLRQNISRCSFIRDGSLAPELTARIRRCALAITREPYSIDDIQQEVMIRLLNIPRDRWEAVTHKDAYVIKIAQNVSRTWLKKRRARDFKHRVLMNTELHKLEGPPTDVAGAACAVDDLVRILKPLGPECAEVFVRVRLDGWLADDEEHYRVFRRLFDRWCGTSSYSTELGRAGSAIDAAMEWRDFIFNDLLYRVGDPLVAKALLRDTYRRYVLLGTADLQHSQSVRACLWCLSRSVAAAHSQDVNENFELGEQWGLRVDAGLPAEGAVCSPLEQTMIALERLQGLPKRQREILSLSTAHHYTVKGTARKLGISPASVKAAMESAVRTIRSLVRADIDVEAS
jgi:DNA-directed RNA polymerase specialized sigma24 family protein